jgi:chromosome segregation ATPase
MNRKSAIVGCAGLMLLLVSLPSPAITFKSDSQEAAPLNGSALKATGAKTYGSDVLKPDALKACVAESAKLNALDKEVKQQKQGLHSSSTDVKAENAALAKMDLDLKTQSDSLAARTAALKAEAATLDNGNKDAVAAYNAKLAILNQDQSAYNEKIRDLNERSLKLKSAADTRNADIPAFNAKVNDLNQRLDAFDEKCADKNYYEDDYAAAKAALKK